MLFKFNSCAKHLTKHQYIITLIYAFNIQRIPIFNSSTIITPEYQMNLVKYYILWEHECNLIPLFNFYLVVILFNDSFFGIGIVLTIYSQVY